MTRRSLPLIGALFGAAAMLAFPTVAFAAPGAPAAGGGTQAFVRTAHLSPDTPGVDVYLSSGASTATVIRAETYGTFSPYVTVPSGSYTAAVRLAGAAPTSSPLVSWQLTLAGGDAYTAAVIGSGGNRRGTTLRDDLTPPSQGHARVRLIQAASNAASANVVANGSIPVAANAPYASVTQYVELPAGTWPLSASSVGGSAATAVATISLPSESVDSIVLLDTAGGGLRLISTLDSAGSAVMPAAGVNTGGGGLASDPRSPTRDFALTVLTVVVLAAFSVYAFVSRLTRRRPSAPCS